MSGYFVVVAAGVSIMGSASSGAAKNTLHPLDVDK